MATYYVRISGNDSNDGLTPDTAFRTIAKALSVIVNGDIIYVGAGVYDEGDLNPADNGITLIGDITGEYTGDAGPVIIGAEYTGNTGSSMKTHWFLTDKSNITVKNFCVITFHAFEFTANVSGLTIENCWMYLVDRVLWETSTGGITSAEINKCFIKCAVFHNAYYNTPSTSTIIIKNSIVLSLYSDYPAASGKGATFKIYNCNWHVGYYRNGSSVWYCYNTVCTGVDFRYYYHYRNFIHYGRYIGTAYDSFDGFLGFIPHKWREKPYLFMYPSDILKDKSQYATTNDLFGRPALNAARDWGPIEVDYGEPTFGVERKGLRRRKVIRRLLYG